MKLMAEVDVSGHALGRQLRLADLNDDGGLWDEQRLHVYAPAELPQRSGKRYAPLKPDANLSNYQVNYSIPRWI